MAARLVKTGARGGRSVASNGAGERSGLPVEALWLACSRSPAFFMDQFCQLNDLQARGWQPFRLWPAQVAAADTLLAHRLCVILKARQLGISWLTVGFSLWLMLFRPAATVLLFSKRDDEAVHLLNFRLRGMYDRLPVELQARAIERDNAHEFRLSNGSSALAFPTTGGRSYTATLAVVDEADFAEDLDGLLNAVKPTIDAGGRLILLSTVDKSHPESAFKRIYRAAAKGENGYAPVFLPWQTRPGRTGEWYEEQVKDVRARTGGLDDLYQEYPATVAEALAPRAVDKAFPAEFLNACYAPCELPGGLSLPSQDTPPPPRVIVHVQPQPDRHYVIGVDPAEGNPNSDESAAVVLDAITSEQVATLGERTDPALFAAHVESLGLAYNNAPVMVERNNHGHAVLLWLRQSARLRLLRGRDDDYGWLTTGYSKHLAFDHAAKVIREGGLIIHDEPTFLQMASVDGSTLAAPPGQHDDRAIACILALAALEWCSIIPGPCPIIPAIDVIAEADRGWW